jgi:hypothetical protein
VAHPDALAMVLPYLDNPATKAEAGLAVVGIGQKILRANRKEVVQALQKVLKSTDDPNLKERVNAVLGPPAKKRN